MAQTIYFDESGFTGSNLLHPDQQFFAYASVATDNDEAKAYVKSLIRKYRIDSEELQGSRLLKFHRGRKAINETLGRFRERLKISVSDKKFALACKIHEYIFEPCYSQASSFFYDAGFHRFVANYRGRERTLRQRTADSRRN